MMSDTKENPPSLELCPLPYHEALRAYLKTEEPEVWNWYASNRVRAEQAEDVRFELLKSTYRVDRDAQPKLYSMAEEVASSLGLDTPITLYQAQNPQGLGASLAFAPDEAHIVLHGPVAARLSEAEFRALLAHELGHFLLGHAWGGEYLIVEQILAALMHDPRAEPPHFASARLLALYSEVFCDRSSLRVTGEPMAVISMLLKIQTQLEEVNPQNYLAQAEEVFRRADARTNELDHPEAFIRARAVWLWSEGDPDADRKIQEMLEGRLALDRLDLVAQKKAVVLTRRLLDVFLSQPWMRSEAVLAHARLFFEDYVPPASLLEDRDLADDLRTDDLPMQDYYGCVLLDFVTVDRDLEELPLAWALALSERLGLRERFLDLVRRELHLRKKQLESIDRDKESLLAKAAEDRASP